MPEIVDSKGNEKVRSDATPNIGANEGSGHGPMPTPADSFGNFIGLKNMKQRAKSHSHAQFEDAAGIDKPFTDSGEPTCMTEDHSFMFHKAGCPETLPGQTKLKEAWDR
jgi:hypothetical protein